jgi:hypothetical protein
MSEITLGVNWIAVVVGAVVSFLLGWLWYSPKLFGTRWAEGAKVSLSEGSEMPIGAMIAQAIGTILLSWIVGVTAVASQLTTMILITLTIVVLMIASGLFSQKSNYTIKTEAGFVVAMVVIMIICQGIFS